MAIKRARAGQTLEGTFWSAMCVLFAAVKAKSLFCYLTLQAKEEAEQILGSGLDSFDLTPFKAALR